MRRRPTHNPFQVGDSVVIRQGKLDGLVGQVIAREDGGRVLVAIECGAASVFIRVPHRSLKRKPADEQPRP